MLRDLGSGATLEHLDVSYYVIFDNDYLLAGEVEERSPMATMRSGDVARAGLGKDAVVRIVNPFDGSKAEYRVRRVEPDGTGMTRVILGS